MEFIRTFLNFFPIQLFPAVQKPISSTSSSNYFRPFNTSTALSNSVRPIVRIPPISTSSSEKVPLWKSSLTVQDHLNDPLTKPPAPTIHEVIPLDGLSTLERKQRQTQPKSWFSSSVDSTVPPPVNLCTLPRNFPSFSKSEAPLIARSRSFKVPQIDDTIIEVPPPKPSRSYTELIFQEMTPMTRPNIEPFALKLTPFERPKLDCAATSIFMKPPIDVNNNIDKKVDVKKLTNQSAEASKLNYFSEHQCTKKSHMDQYTNKSSMDQYTNKSHMDQCTKKSNMDQYTNKSNMDQCTSKSNMDQCTKKSIMDIEQVKPKIGFIEQEDVYKPLNFRSQVLEQNHTAKPPPNSSKLDSTQHNPIPSCSYTSNVENENKLPEKSSSRRRSKNVRERSSKRRLSNLSNILSFSDDEDDDSADSEAAEWLRSSLVLRQQPSLRVKAIVDKLLHMSGRDQRRALFSLKQIFQDDKDLVHEFVQNEGLPCLIKLGRVSDQNHQNYILRALGQLMLYVDGMNGIIAHNETIQWLYELLDSPYRLVVKTALKLLLVFVEYTEANSLLLLAAISKVEKARGRQDWLSLMKILMDKSASDEETLIYGMTVINKTLNGVPDQDTYFDIIDTLESQGLEDAMKFMTAMNSPQLTQQCEFYEKELRREEGALDSDSGESTIVRMRSTNGPTTRTNGTNGDTNDRRGTMRRRQQEAAEYNNTEPTHNKFNENLTRFQQPQQNGHSTKPPVIEREPPTPKTPIAQTPSSQPPWRRSTVNESPQEEPRYIETNNNHYSNSNSYSNGDKYADYNGYNSNSGLKESIVSSRPQPIKLIEDVEQIEEKENITNGDKPRDVKAPPPLMPNIFSPTEHKTMEFPEPEEKPIEQPTLKKIESPPKAKLADSDSDENGAGANCFAAALKKRAQKMEGGTLRKGLVEQKVSEAEAKWKQAAENVKEKPMIINDLDFSEFVEFEQDPLVLVKAQASQDNGRNFGYSNGAPPAPPPIPGGAVPPPPPLLSAKNNQTRDPSPGGQSKTSASVKLHWKPAQVEAPQVLGLKRKGTFWSLMETPAIDTEKLAKLFEQKTKDVPVKKAGEDVEKKQVLHVLSMKRSQAINIGLTKLPPVSVIPTAIRKFDSTVLNKEGIEKILQTMMPTLEEIERIREKQCEHPDMPLGQAEQFLVSLSEIDCLLERLRLWSFMLDYQNVEKDVAESLMELNNAMKEIEESRTFRVAMGMMLKIGNTLNGTDIKAFQLDYLSKASEVKDPVHKYPLTHHLAEYMIDHFPDGTDLYSEFGAVSRSSRIDFEMVHDNLKKMENDCKASWDYVAKISLKDNNSNMKNKVNAYLTEVAERIHRLKHVHRTTMNRWHAFLLYFGYAPNEIKDQKPIGVFKMVIEFALEYRTNRDKILQTRKRVAEKRERNKTRGMMIGVAQKQQQNGTVDSSRRKNPEELTDRERHQELSRLLTSSGDDTLNRRRGQPTSEKSLIAAQTEAMRRSPGDGESADDELLDGVVRTVTAQADSIRDHARRRARQFNRKSLRRTRTIRSDQLDSLTNLSVLNNY
uniref:FH1/FH2 domain-containing protein 3 n=1 Tax=Acrobeloides nanus TaxID=290746 RepID=A0A914BYP5_9BILA